VKTAQAQKRLTRELPAAAGFLPWDKKSQGICPDSACQKSFLTSCSMKTQLEKVGFSLFF
jgi:hypothetical protein